MCVLSPRPYQSALSSTLSLLLLENLHQTEVNTVVERAVRNLVIFSVMQSC